MGCAWGGGGVYGGGGAVLGALFAARGGAAMLRCLRGPESFGGVRGGPYEYFAALETVGSG